MEVRSFSKLTGSRKDKAVNVLYGGGYCLKGVCAGDRLPVVIQCRG
jgi:hypothetical protein